MIRSRRHGPDWMSRESRKLRMKSIAATVILGEDIRKIARLFDVSVQTVRNACREHSVPVKSYRCHSTPTEEPS